MPEIELNDLLRDEYRLLYAQAPLRPERAFEVDAAVARITAPEAWACYQGVEAALGVPAHVVVIIHSLESGARFDRHLHIGDPLTARTVQVPKGRPKSGEPPFTWEDSATDALRLRKLDRWKDWSAEGIGVFTRSGRRIASVNLGFAGFG